MSSLNQALRAALDNRHDLLAELHAQGTDCYRLFHDNALISGMHTKLFFGMLVRMPSIVWRRWRA